ncbi:bifunctional serine/threonine-protein kinase/formylglycine-generating enzyme family protein [Myxococcota bacterium]|nr:bifunctional serine/threonine-protein kinase/formylglycine-generating enzyme family protein [Myxococcota bacterium]
MAGGAGGRPGPTGPLAAGAPALGRFVPIRELGVGGMGRVYEAEDPDLGRRVAVKVPLAPPGDGPAMARFLAEARITGRLQHQGIVPVHELGLAGDGRAWYAMRKVEGRSLRSVLEDLDRGDPATAAAFTRHRLLSAFVQVCHAVAFAHDRGVVHRDLKPENVMLGEYGEVLVLDWGVARVLGDAEEPAAGPGPDRPATAAGEVVGTPGYLSPEQAWGDHGRVGPPSDVFGLGAILYELLAGSPPYRAPDPYDRLHETAAGPPEDPRARASGPIPEDLALLCMRALAARPEERLASARDLARGVEESLDGSLARDRALGLVARAAELLARAEAERGEETRLRAEAERESKAVGAWEPEERKARLWSLEDAATATVDAWDRAETEAVEVLHSALELSPALPEARATLAAFHRRRLVEAEDARDRRGAERAASLLATYDDGTHAAFLQGDGALTVLAEPTARVDLERYEVRGRRLVPVPAGNLGTTPLRAVPLPRGSYRLVLRARGHAPVFYPVRIRRGEHWDASGSPVLLPREGALGPGEVYVPGGPFECGGDPDALFPQPRSHPEIAAFVVRRFPVTNREYLEFLDDLVARGREEEALRHAPRERSSRPGELGALIVGRVGAGRFRLAVDAEGDAWDLDWPVCMVDWHGAAAYAEWQAERDGVPWRLAFELEREKAARGVDGRFFPWGDAFDPAFACVRESHRDRPQPAVVDSFPADDSPYGVRGLAGNMRDWCADVFRPEGPAPPPGKVPTPDPDAPRVYRGGSWSFVARSARAADRSGSLPGDRWANVGFRLARGW